MVMVVRLSLNTTVINFDGNKKATFAGDIAVGDDIFLHTDEQIQQTLT